jgi:hypothetical protein
MNKIRIYFDYRCFPVWIYNDKGELIDNDLPKEVRNDKQVDDAFVEIQNIYDSLFINNSNEFKYIGFNSATDRDEYLKMVDEAVNLLKTKLGNLYVVEKMIKL